MGRAIKYQVGCIINNCELLSRDYKTSENGAWVATFKCLHCGEIFQNRINRVVDGIKNCSCGRKTPAAQLAGTTKGVWKIIERAPSRENDRNAYWKCQCTICGKEFESSTANINRRNHDYCDHQGSAGLSKGGRNPSLSAGMTFGKLTVKEYLGDRLWKCQCSCGRFTKKRTDLLTMGKAYACPVCCGVSKGEAKLYDLLTNMGINFEQQKTFDTCRFKDTNALAKFDFFLTDLNILIEYNGEQHYHYRADNSWNNEGHFKATQNRDEQKIEWCKQNNFPLLIIPYTDFNILDEGYLQEKINELIKK